MSATAAPTSSFNETQRCSDLYNVFSPAPKIPRKLFPFFFPNCPEVAGQSVQSGQLFGPVRLISGAVVITIDGTMPNGKVAWPH